MSQKKRDERRQFRRYRAVGERSIQFKLMMRAPGPEDVLHGVMVNRSNRGLCIRFNATLRREQVLRLSLPFGSKKTTAPTLGEVRWTKRKFENGNGYLAGIRYLL